MAQYVQVVVPELVFYEESNLRTYGSEESTGIGDSIDREVADDIRSLVVLSHLISRGREESEQNLIFRTMLTQILNNRATLLKLAQRCCVHPDITCIWVNLLAKNTPISVSIVNTDFVLTL